MWDDTISQWIRSGKTINHVKRRKQHEVDFANVLLDSRFYSTRRLKWTSMKWYQVLALTPAQATAACGALYMNEKWDSKLQKKTKREDMLGYLCELLPLGMHCVKNYE